MKRHEITQCICFQLNIEDPLTQWYFRFFPNNLLQSLTLRYHQKRVTQVKIAGRRAPLMVEDFMVPLQGAGFGPWSENQDSAYHTLWPKDLKKLLVDSIYAPQPTSEQQTPLIPPTYILFSLSVVSDSATSWTATRQASLSITISQSLLKLMSMESVMSSNHLILCCPLLLLPSIFPSARVFCNESTVGIRWPKCQSFSFSISPSNEYLGYICI